MLVSLLLLLGSVQVASAAERGPVLFVGDSHSTGTFGRATDALLRGFTPEELKEARRLGIPLSKLLREKLGNTDVFAFASCGSRPRNWYPNRGGDAWVTPCGYREHLGRGYARERGEGATPFIRNLMSLYQPRVVVVALGANDVQSETAKMVADSEKFARIVTSQGAPCIWVGPPHGRNKPEPGFGKFYKELEKAVSPFCQFIDSRPFAHYPDTGGDGVHYDRLGAAGSAMAEDWAIRAFAEMKLPD